MTKQEAISELMRCAELCPSTLLAEACRVAAEAVTDYELAYLKGQKDGIDWCQKQLRKVNERVDNGKTD